MRITTRTRATILTGVITVLFFVLQSIDFLDLLKIDFVFDFIKPTILAIVTYFGVAWVLSFRVGKERFLTVLLFPALSIFILTLYVELILGSIFQDVDRIAVQLFASFVVAFIAYILILTTNILNVSYLDKIPLGQAGRAAHYVLTLVSSYLFFSLIFSNSIFIPIKLTSIFLLSWLYSFMALWTIDLRANLRLVASFAIGLSMFIFAGVLMMWPVPSEYLALILSLIFYMSLGIALEIREVLSKKIWIEYAFIYFVIVTILFLMSVWGINGRLI